MIEIEFLPESYRARRQTSHARLWSLVLCGMFGSVVAVTSVVQYSQGHHAQATRETLRKELQQAELLREQFEKTESELAQASDTARLYVWLRHTRPRSQLLKLAAETLPAAMTLTELRFTTETARVVEESLPVRTRETAEPSEPSAADVLTQLRAERARQSVVLIIAGETADSTFVHEYAESLGRSPLLMGVQLESVEQVRRGDAGTGRIAFRLRAMMAPLPVPSATPVVARREAL
jgi:hypothetical protein